MFRRVLNKSEGWKFFVTNMQNIYGVLMNLTSGVLEKLGECHNATETLDSAKLCGKLWLL